MPHDVIWWTQQVPTAGIDEGCQPMIRVDGHTESANVITKVVICETSSIPVLWICTHAGA